MAEARKGIAGLAEDLARERKAVANRSAPYERALALLPVVLDGPPGRYVEAAWEHRRFFAWYDRPLLLLAALRDDALAEGPTHPLWAGFAAPEPDPKAVSAKALAAALDGARERVFDALARRGVQTNETARAVAWLWPAALAGADRGARSIALADLGASAGLNLVADALPNVWTAEDGAPLPVAHEVHAVSRLGLDPAPLDATREEDARWLRACIWPGEPGRLARLEAALAAYRAARPRPDAPVLVPITAREIPARLDLLSGTHTGTLVVAYQTIMRAYLGPAERAAYEAGMHEWLGAHPPGLALWVELEAAERGTGGDTAAALTAHVRAPWGAVRAIELGRCGYHPSRVERNATGAAELAALLRPQAGAGAVA